MKTLAITPLQRPVNARVSIPGSKSYTNRALILAALSKGKVVIRNPLMSDDTRAMIDCLNTLGIQCVAQDDSIEVSGGIDAVKDGVYELDANLSGTTIRFMLALSVLLSGTKILRGRARLNERPIADLVDALRQLGARIEYAEKEGFPPLKILPSGLASARITMNGSVSSQFLSSMLMIAPAVGDVEIEITGEQVSKPYINMTIDTMEKFGASVVRKGESTYFIPAAQYELKEYVVEGDVSSASYFSAIATLTGSTITLSNMNPSSLQADMGFLRILERMGNEVSRGEGEITMRGRCLVPVDVDMRDCPDQVQTLAALAACAKGTTRISGIESLRVKETERVAALERELAKMGIRSHSDEHALTIHGGEPRPAVIDTYWDHRMAMAFATLGTKLPGMEIRNPEVVSKTFPDFWEKLNAIGVETRSSERDPNLVLIGMRGSGKSTIAKLLAQRLGRPHVELDALVEQRAGMSIRDLVEKSGWEAFRDLETELVREISSHDGAVVSTGGGIVTRTENIEAIKRNGLCIFLYAPVEALIGRIREENTQRPRLTGAASLKEEMETLFTEREKLYEAAADETIDTSKLDPEEAVEQIVIRLKERGIVEK